MGVAVLVFDRRGTGRSTGSLTNIDYQTLADDGIAGARAIAKLPSIDPKRIGYWGISQGEWLAMLAGGRDPNANFVISVSAPLTSPEQQMEFAMSNRLEILKYSQADVDAMIAARKAWTAYLRGQGTQQQAVEALSAIAKKPWFDLMYFPSPVALTRTPATSSWRKKWTTTCSERSRTFAPPFFASTGVRTRGFPCERRLRAFTCWNRRKRTSATRSSHMRATRWRSYRRAHGSRCGKTRSTRIFHGVGILAGTGTPTPLAGIAPGHGR